MPASFAQLQPGQPLLPQPSPPLAVEPPPAAPAAPASGPAPNLVSEHFPMDMGLAMELGPMGTFDDDFFPPNGHYP